MSRYTIGAVPVGAAPKKEEKKHGGSVTSKSWFWPAVAAGVGVVGFTGYKVYKGHKK